MEKITDFFDKTFRKDVYQNMLNEQENQSLVQILNQMQTSGGINPEEAAVTTSTCIAAVTSCESVRSEFADNHADALLDKLLDEAEKCDDCHLILNKLCFGLSAYPGFVAANETLSPDELFWRYYAEKGKSRTIEELKDEIRNVLKDYWLTPQVMWALIERLESSGDYLATATALGEDGISFKCIAAMELYLNNRDTVTIHEAANAVCATVESQAAADAVSRGMITRDAAKKILLIAGITLAVVGLGIMVYQSGCAAALAKTAISAAEEAIASIPEIFRVFKVDTVTSDIRTVYTPLIKTARHRELIGGILLVFGLLTATLSEKSANLIGKIRTGATTTEKDRVKSGLQQIADSLHLPEETISFQTDRQLQWEGLSQVQSQSITPGTT